MIYLGSQRFVAQVKLLDNLINCDSDMCFLGLCGARSPFGFAKRLDLVLLVSWLRLRSYSFVFFVALLYGFGSSACWCLGPGSAG